MARVARGWAAAIAAVVALAGCSGPAAAPPDDVIPAALLASDIGIVSAYAGNFKDGFATNLHVGVEFDHEDVTSRDLAAVLQVIVDNADVDRYNFLTVVGRFGGDESTGTLIDLVPLSEELGFESDGVNDDWFHQRLSAISSTIGSD